MQKMKDEEFTFKLYYSNNIEFNLYYQIFKSNLSILIYFFIFILLFAFLLFNIKIDYVSYISIVTYFKINNIILSIVFYIIDIIAIVILINLILFLFLLLLFPFLIPVYYLLFNIFNKIKNSKINYLREILNFYLLYFHYFVFLIRIKKNKLKYYNPLFIFILPIAIIENPNFNIEELLIYTDKKIQNKLGIIAKNLIVFFSLINVTYIINFILIYSCMIIISLLNLELYGYTLLYIAIILFIFIFLNLLFQLIISFFRAFYKSILK